MSGQAYGSAGAGPGGCARDVNGCIIAGGILAGGVAAVALIAALVGVAFGWW